MAAKEFQKLVAAYFAAVAYQNKLKDEMAASDNPIAILQIRIDVDEYQQAITMAKRMIDRLT